MRGVQNVPERRRESKARLRRTVLTRRNRMRSVERDSTATALRDVLLDVAEVNRAAILAAYVGVGSEPGTGPLLEALMRRGTRILLPIVQDGNDLDWAVHTPEHPLMPSALGIPEPTGPRLGPEAIGTADAVLLPGLAVDHDGARLGRGGGSYDRAMARIAPDAFSCIVLYDHEVSEKPVPTEPHDRPVQAAATPSGLIRFRRS